MTTQVTGSGVNFNGSTSGTITLTQPAIAGTNTVTLPAETGTLRSTVSSGTVLQVVNYQTGAVATGTTLMPFDDTIPQITEGNEYMTLAITPKSATSKLIIQVVWCGTSSFIDYLTTALFQDAAPDALATVAQVNGTGSWMLANVLVHVMTSATTSSTTFKIRTGGNSGSGTTTFNGSASARRFGGSLASSITITEVVP
jgi:hypothetical protein